MIRYLYLNSEDYSNAMAKALKSYLATKMKHGHIEDLAINSAEFFEASYHVTSALGEELFKKIIPINTAIEEITKMYDLADIGSDRKDILEEVLKVIERNLND